jgi:2-keto-4-pentenoate hydratase/2-oxohepta-3-ene-1,7-dioic acid hydratase in catechol pathway
MRFASHRTSGGPRLIAAAGDGWVDVAQATGDERHCTLEGLLAATDGVLDPVLRAAVDAAVPVPGPGNEELGPIVRPARVFCVGRNYVEHRDEFHNAPTEWPEVFLRLPTSVTGPFDAVPRSSVISRLDYEGELALIVGRGGRHIAVADAPSHVFAYTVANDISARDWQHRGGQWTAGKNFDGTLPLGPHAITADALDASDLLLETRVNGETVQSARTSQMIFDLATQIEFISSWTALIPGDVIVTGTPGGVGAARTPPLLLQAGDVVEVEIEGIGALRNHIVDDAAAPATGHWHAVANRDPTADR